MKNNQKTVNGVEYRSQDHHLYELIDGAFVHVYVKGFPQMFFSDAPLALTQRKRRMRATALKVVRELLEKGSLETDE